MTGKMLVVAAGLFVALCTANVHAQQFNLNALDSNSDLNYSNSYDVKTVQIGRLPSDFFHDETVEKPAVVESSNSSTANVLVVAGLSLMLVLGCTITGISVMLRRKSKRAAPTLNFVNA